MAAAIHQHQRPVDSQMAKVEEIQPDFAEPGVGTRGEVPRDRTHQRR